jgi:CheY-like chemotaxis protein/GAF domain-containing protein
MTTVLIVDDRPVNRDLVRTILGYEGYDVVEAESGPEALRVISQGLPDNAISLVISDVLMPGMDGYELAREIRSSAESRDLPIVFYTANYLEQEARPIAAACGVEHIVAKDGDPRALVNAVTQALHRDHVAMPPEIVDEDFSREHLRVLNGKLLDKVRELEEKEQLGKLVDAAIVVSGDLGLQTTLNRVASTARALVSAQRVTVLLRDDAGYEIGSAHDGAVTTPGPSTPRLTLTITAKDGQHGTLEVVGKIGGERFSDNDRRLLNSLTEAAAVALANAHRYDDARRRQAWLRAAAEITALLLGGDPAEALPTVVARARTVANAAVAWIEPAERDQESGGSALGRSAASELGARLLERVAAAGAPVLVEDASSELPASDPAGNTVADLDGIGPLLAVPMQAREDLLGVLILANRRHRRPFTALDVEMATTFAGQAAVAVEFARARTDRERLRVVEERHRIARDLHDIVIQRLFATGLRLESMAGALPEPQAEAVRDATTELDRRHPRGDLLLAQPLAATAAAAAGDGDHPHPAQPGLHPDGAARRCIGRGRAGRTLAARHRDHHRGVDQHREACRGAARGGRHQGRRRRTRRGGERRRARPARRAAGERAVEPAAPRRAGRRPHGDRGGRGRPRPGADLAGTAAGVTPGDGQPGVSSEQRCRRTVRAASSSSVGRPCPGTSTFAGWLASSCALARVRCSS